MWCLFLDHIDLLHVDHGLYGIKKSVGVTRKSCSFIVYLSVVNEQTPISTGQP